MKTYRLNRDGTGSELRKDSSAKWTFSSGNLAKITAGNDEDPAFVYYIPEGMTTPAEKKRLRNYAVVGVDEGREVVSSLEEYYVDIPISDNYYSNLFGGATTYTYYKSVIDDEGNVTPDTANPGTVSIGKLGLDKNSSSKFEVEIQVVMRYGRDPSANKALVGTRGVVFMRRGMFTLD